MKFCNKYGFEEIINISPILYVLGYGVFFISILYTLYLLGSMVVKIAML